MDQTSTGKNPWELDWGVPIAPQAAAPAGGQNPWEMDWGVAPAEKPGVRFTPVDHDPFAEGGPKFVPVDHDPFEKPGIAEDFAKSAGIGLAKGVIGVAGMPADVASQLASWRDAGIDNLHRFILRGFGATPEQVEESVAKYHKAIETPTPFSHFPKALSSGDIQSAIEQATGPFYEPQRALGRYAQTVGEFIPAALTGGEGAVANLVKGALVPGVASEYAGSKLQDTPLEPYARAAGAVVGGVGAHAADIGRAAAKTYGAQREAAREVGRLVGEPDVNAGAVSRMAKDVANDQLTPERAAAQARALGPDAMMLDMGRQLQGRAEAIATQPGKGQNTVLNAVEGRTGVVGFDPAQGRYTSSGEGTAGRVKGTLDQTMGASPNVVTQAKDIANHVDSIAGPLYEKVMAEHPVVNVPADITSRPSVAQAMKDAVSLAKEHGEKLVGPTETKTILRGDGYHMAEDVTPQAQTSLRYWDYVKKALDSRINGMMKSGGVATLDSAEKADLGGMIASRNALRDHLDEVTDGAYATARSVAATKPQMKEALQFGRDALNTKLLPEEMTEQFDNMSIPQQSMARLGMRREVERIIDTARNDAAAARNVLNTNQNREKIAAMFGEGTARRIDDRIAAETKFQEATNKISQSSRTGVRAQLVKDTESPSISQPPQANLTGFAVKGLNKLRDLHAAGVLERTRAGLGAMSTTPAENVPDLVRILAGYNARAAQNARPPVAPYASNLARVLAVNTLNQGGQEQRRP
jgi:hypothetical protein